MALLGPTLSTLKIVAIVASSVAGTALYRIAAPRDRAAAIACVALYPIFMVVCGDVIYQMINATLLVAFALAFGEPVGRGRAAAAGLAIGLACAIKQTCAIDALAVAYVLWARAGRERRSVGVLAAFAAATPIIPAGFFLYYVWLGAADVFIADVVVAAWRRGADVSLGAALSSWADCLFPASVVLIVAAAALTRPVEPGRTVCSARDRRLAGNRGRGAGGAARRLRHLCHAAHRAGAAHRDQSGERAFWRRGARAPRRRLGRVRRGRRLGGDGRPRPGDARETAAGR